MPFASPIVGMLVVMAEVRKLCELRFF